MTKEEATLGDILKDTITGFEGTAVARTEWLNGCVRLTLQPSKLQKDGKPYGQETFDVEQLALVKAMKKPASKPSGGDRENITRARDPR